MADALRVAVKNKSTRLRRILDRRRDAVDDSYEICIGECNAVEGP